MAVKVVDKSSGESFTGKLAIIKGDEIALWSGVKAGKQGGLSGCGRKRVFALDKVDLSADNPEQEIKRP